MKTQGVTVLPSGRLLLAYGRAVPDQFWARLKHELQKRALLDEFAADYRRERSAALTSSPEFSSEALVAQADAEERLFRRWVERLGLYAPRWPGDTGWTDAEVDAYLAPKASGKAA